MHWSMYERILIESLKCMSLYTQISHILFTFYWSHMFDDDNDDDEEQYWMTYERRILFVSKKKQSHSIPFHSFLYCYQQILSAIKIQTFGTVISHKINLNKTEQNNKIRSMKLNDSMACIYLHLLAQLNESIWFYDRLWCVVIKKCLPKRVLTHFFSQFHSSHHKIKRFILVPGRRRS